MRKTFSNKFIALILSLILVLTTAIPAFGETDTNDVYLQYSGTTDASYGYKPNCTFTIFKINGNKFRGNFSASNLGSYSFNEPVEGVLYTSGSSITCSFTVKFFNGRYYSNILITVYPFLGYCECLCVGSWHMEDFIMYGTKLATSELNTSINISSYNEDDMKLCMEFSNAAYDKQFTHNVPNDIIDVSKTYSFNSNELIKSNAHKNRHEANNISYTLLPNFSSNDNIVDLYVILRGTTEEEWQGNMEITGTTYKITNQHESFKNGANYLKNEINTYISRNYNHYKNKTVNLHITGHSRGAAVANLYAKYITDNPQLGVGDKTINTNEIVAYTFATPNVEKFHNAMSNYDNIFNFCFYEDFVPTIPLTMPDAGWNYWKYGNTYWVSLSDLMANRLIDNFTVNAILNKNDVVQIHKCMTKWNTVEKYYDEQCYDISNSYSTTAYEFFHDAFAKAMMPGIKNKAIGFYSIYSNFKQFSDFVPLILTTGKNLPTVVNAHNYNVYNTVISRYGSYYFSYCSYNTYKNIFSDINYNSNSSISYLLTQENDLTEYNSQNVTQLISFLNTNQNMALLNWVVNSPETWNGVTWDSEGNVESISLPYLNLTGSIDLSNFTSLKSLNISGNNLTSINLDNCSSLEEIDCSFNKLISLDLSDCTSLTSVTCCYNYLDIHEGGTLYNTLDDLMFNDCYVNYYPQSVPENATFNTTELNALKTFANTDNNESILDWLDDDGNIDTEKLQNNILFEYDGSNYRVVAIDISDTNVEGTLNLTSFAQLKELYCENTKLVSLNLNGCTKLNTLHCDGSNLTTLTLPSNSSQKTSPLYDVSCEYNYIDTSIFTPTIVEYVNFKAGANLEYENQKGDSSALQSALSFANELEEKDYSASTYEPLKDLLDECNYYNFDNLYLTQEDIDELTSEILSAIYELEAYFDVVIAGTNGTITINCNSESLNLGKHSLLYATEIKLNATPDDGYTFAGWYDTVNNIYVSKNAEYTFKVSSNIKLKAVFIADGSSTLTFANYSNWIAGTVTKTTQEWAELTAISDMLPDVPYRYGYSNGRWVYNDADVLGRLQSGENVIITAEYDEDDTSLPEPLNVTDEPVLGLYYKYDSNNCVGSFVMASGFPENIQIEEIGIAFYYKDANTFDPTDNFTLILNNKMMTSRFNTDTLEDIYIVNMNKMTSKYNWASRGYVTYRDGNNMVTVYSNQVNIVDRQDILTTPFGLINYDNTGDNLGNKHNIDVIEGECD